MKAIWNPDFEPEWDTIGIRSTDFRPQFDGDLVNVFSVFQPKETKEETEEMLRGYAVEIAQWILDHEKRFKAGDRFQIILGLPKSIRDNGRQVVKSGGTYSELRSLISSPVGIYLMPKWEHGIFEKQKSEQGGAANPLQPSASGDC